MSSSKMDCAQDWLRALINMSITEDMLDAQLVTWHNDRTVFEAYSVSELVQGIESAEHRWNAEYFRKQINAAKKNFSHERAKHLLKVRKKLQQQGVEGFLPRASQKKGSDPIARVAPAFVPTPSLSKAMSSGEVGLIRAALGLEISDIRLSGSYLQGAMAWVTAQNENIFAPYDEGRFKGSMDSDKSIWTIDYHDSQLVFLKSNFSAERFLHVVEVREYLRTTGAPGFKPPAKETATQSHIAPTSTPGSQRPERIHHETAGSMGKEHGHTGKDPVASPSGSWSTRIAIILTAALAALAAYFIGGRR